MVSFAESGGDSLEPVLYPALRSQRTGVRCSETISPPDRNACQPSAANKANFRLNLRGLPCGNRRRAKPCLPQRDSRTIAAMPTKTQKTARTKPLGSDTLTRGVRVRVTPSFLPEQSSPEHGKYLFGYRITISNEGARRVQLLSRHWIIIDADGERHEVKGPGVVGETPTIEPGDSHTYSSFCPLETPWGTMEGTYQMRDGDGEEFDAAIGRFVLTTDSARA
jgi:ApaG protein